MPRLGRLPTRASPPPLFICSFPATNDTDVPSSTGSLAGAGAGKDSSHRIAEILPEDSIPCLSASGRIRCLEFAGIPLPHPARRSRLHQPNGPRRRGSHGLEEDEDGSQKQQRIRWRRPWWWCSPACRSGRRSVSISPELLQSRNGIYLRGTVNKEPLTHKQAKVEAGE